MIESVALTYQPGYAWVCLRELCGKDEQQIMGARSLDAIHLLEGMASIRTSEDGPKCALRNISIADRDRILAVIYKNAFGPRVSTTVKCTSCGKPFDIDFSLDDLIDSLGSNPEVTSEVGDGCYVFAYDHIRFRLPTGADELAVMGMEPEQARKALFSRCLLQGDEEAISNGLADRMEEVAPLIDTDFEAACPECSSQPQLHFNLQQYLLSSLVMEQRVLVAEVHLLARAYSWGLNEILELPRSIRRAYVNHLQED